jgi:hypothetical protein
MQTTIEGEAPRFLITAITAAARLLCNEEADVVAGVICGMKTSGAQDAAVIQRAFPGTMTV